MGLKLLTITIFSGADCESFQGKFLEIQEKEVLDKETGELKKIESIILEDEAGEAFGIWLDAGLKLAIKYCSYGETYKIKHCGKKQLDNNKQVNTYKVWEVTKD